MDFGRITPDELNEVDFNLPGEPAFNAGILKGTRLPSPKIYIGCAKWGRPEWIGKLYPKGTREKNFLAHYVDHYNAIELNATHYKLYGATAIGRWAAKANGKDFLFSPKMHQGVTHRGKLNENKFLLSEFFRGIAAFESHLGPVFIQVSDRFSPKRRDELFDFLKSLPPGFQVFVEVRHPGWFQSDVFDAYLTNLQDLNVGAIITDTAGRRDCVHMHVTIPKAFVRFVGNDLHPTDFARIDRWVERIDHWLNKGLETLYFFMHMQDEAFSPELTVYLIDKLNDVCQLSLQKPVFINPEPDAAK